MKANMTRKQTIVLVTIISTLSAALSAMAMANQIADTEARAIETMDIRIPFTAELYTNTNKNYQLDMEYAFDIQTNGTVTLHIYALNNLIIPDTNSCKVEACPIKIETEGFRLVTSCNQRIYDRGLNSRTWDVIPKQKTCEVALSDSYNMRDSWYNSKVYTIDDYNARFLINKNTDNSIIEISKGELIEFTLAQSAETIYTDQENKMFLKNQDGSKKLF